MLYKNIDWLIQKYCVEKLSLNKLAKLANCNIANIIKYMNLYGIKRRTISEALTDQKHTQERNDRKSEAMSGENAYWYGKHHSEETKLLISQKKSGSNHNMYGKTHSVDSKQKMSASHQGKKMSNEAKHNMSESATKRFNGDPKNHPLYGTERLDIKGDNHHLWNGGVTPLYKSIRRMTKYTHWRNTCFKRDNYTCQKCKTHNGLELHVDHIKAFCLIINENNIFNTEDASTCEELWDINNGQTLCIKCHKETDTFGSKAKKLLVKKNKVK